MNPTDPTMEAETSPTAETEEISTPQWTETSEKTEESSKEEENRQNWRRREWRNDRNKRGPRKEEEQKEFAEELLGVDRVTRVTAGGRQLRFRATVVIGNGKWTVGLGIGKAWEVQGAIEKAVHDAKKNLITFPIVSGTIPHSVTANYKSSALFIHPAHPGTGIIAGGAVRKIFAVSGLKDIIAKQHGAPNKITNARVTLTALQAIRPLSIQNPFLKKKTEQTSDQKIADETPKAEKKVTPKKSTKTKE